jgi:hypothetical protein
MNNCQNLRNQSNLMLRRLNYLSARAEVRDRCAEAGRWDASRLKNSSVLLTWLLGDYGRKIFARALGSRERLGARFKNGPTVKPFFQLVPSKETVVIRIEHS